MGRQLPEPHCRLVKFDATDGVALTGLLYEPRWGGGLSARRKRAAIFLHGMGGSFEPRRSNLLGEELTAAGIAFFPFNNRGSYLIRRLGNTQGGMAFERIRDCVPDIDGAVRELRRRGYRDLTLIGHSTGANKIAVYDHYKSRSFIKRYILVAGGDDTGLAFAHLGTRRRFEAALTKARAMIHAKRGDDLIPPALSPANPLSWRSFYDIANPDGDYNVFPFLEVMRNLRLSRRPRFRHLRGIHKPALILYGEHDEFCYDDVPRCLSILATALGPKPNIELATLADADHGFAGKEMDLGKVIVRWLASR